MQDQPVLELRGIVKDYPGIRALDHVDLNFRKGEVHGLVGENGAGKSTLIKILAGVINADHGEIFIHGKAQKLSSGREAHRFGLSFIHQEHNLVSYFNCSENIFLGHPYPKTLWGTISWKKLREKTQAILQQLDVNIPLNVPIKQLPPGEQAMIAIARAFAESASIYCMDEPTTSLTGHEKDALFSVIRNIKSLGATIIYVSHDLDDILLLTDRITIMRDSRVVGTWTTATLTKDEIITKMIGRDISTAFPPKNTRGEKTVALSVSGLGGENLRDISFDLLEGEILGIAGLLGSGRTELLRMLYGVDPIVQGTVALQGQIFRPESPKGSIQKGLVLVPEERRSQGLLLNRSIYENISLVYLDQLSNGPFLNHTSQKQASEHIGQAVKLTRTDYRYHVNTLSGGNQQKVVFAKYLLRQPAILLLDEPTKGVDVGARFEIYTIIQDMTKQGTAVILVSSDFTELLGLADRILFLHEGQQICTAEDTQLDQETMLQYCYGNVGA